MVYKKQNKRPADAGGKEEKKMICTAHDLTQRAIAIYNDRKNWTYCQGALGQLGESDRVRGLYNYFWFQPYHANNSMTMPYQPWLEAYGRGRHCTDCSNFINYLLGYTFSMYSTEGYAKMPAFAGDINDAPEGTVLCIINDEGKCTHVGLSIGGGEFLDFARYNETCRKAPIKGSLFKKAVYVKGVDYNASPAADMRVQVRDKTRYVGDVLTKNDFVVTIIRQDGSVYVETDFQFTPLRLENTENVIAVVYADFIKYVRIDAVPIGSFYCVQVPAKSKEEALEMQKRLTLEGYPNPAVVEL